MEEIKKVLGTEKLVVGTDKVKKLLRTGELEKVFLASNANPRVKQDLEKYTNISGVEIQVLETSNEDLGTLCKKPFSVSVLAVRK